MTRTIVTAVTCATVLWIGTAQGTLAPQQKCDNARITAWKKYQACVEGVVAKDATDVTPSITEFYVPFWKCRHKYFGKWAKLQSITGSTCVGTRYTDNGDQTVTDNLTGLVWEKKDNGGFFHDKDNTYTWSTGAPYKENGTAFTIFLAGPVLGLNVAGFGGANGWRLPTLAELQTILLDFECKDLPLGPTCICPSSPCVDGALDAMNTQSSSYSSSTTNQGSSDEVWEVAFNGGAPFHTTLSKVLPDYARAVRGGL